MEGIICWPTERNNLSARPGYADFGGHFIPRVSLFVVESSFLITVGLATGTALAIWLAAQIARQLYQSFPFPLGTVALIFLGSYLIAVACIALPSRRASRIPPAEALRYE